MKTKTTITESFYLTSPKGHLIKTNKYTEFLIPEVFEGNNEPIENISYYLTSSKDKVFPISENEWKIIFKNGSEEIYKRQ